MAQTTNTPEGSESSGVREQAGRPGAIVEDRLAVERARRIRRRAGRELDAMCGVERPELGSVQIDYEACGLTLDLPERRAAGLALLAQGRAA